MIKTWHQGMTDKETADLAYWERNCLALYFAEGWYNDDVQMGEVTETRGFVRPIIGPRYDGWRRVLTINGGAITFHIPDDFDVGSLPEVAPNWDGHTTEEKWRKILIERGACP